jgi:hypothetical protein
MKFANANKFDRKSGVAQWRDLRFLFRFSQTLQRPGENAQFRDLNHSWTSHRPHVVYQGTLQLAEKLIPL